MKPGLISLLLAMTSCASQPLGPPAILIALDELPPGKIPRLYLGASQAPRWAVPIELDALPTAVDRTAQAVLPDGNLNFVGRIYGGPEDAYLIERLYPQLGNHYLRRLIVASDGRVLLRSHSLPEEQAPGPVAARIAAMGRLESLEFVEGEGKSYYRAMIVDAGSGRRVTSFTPEGTSTREARVLAVQTTVSR